MNGEHITTTPQHPFWVPQKGWTAAIDLRAGDRLQILNGEYVVIEQIQHELLESPVTVYNFEVEGFHTYCVTDSAILVHNKCGDNQSNYNLNGAKSESYMNKRGWSPDKINAAINNGPMGTAINKANNMQSTVYCYPGTNYYVVVEDSSRNVVQFSQFGNDNWIPDNTINWEAP